MSIHYFNPSKHARARRAAGKEGDVLEEYKKLAGAFSLPSIPEPKKKAKKVKKTVKKVVKSRKKKK